MVFTGYKSLKALKLRPYDKAGMAFLKKVSKRIPDTKSKGGIGSISSDEERPHRSPKLLQKLKFS